MSVVAPTWLVTGANKGIGYAIAKGLAQAGCFVYLGSRDKERGEAAVKELITTDASLASSVQFVQLDVTSDASVQAAVAAITSREGFFALDGLVNNAGGSTAMYYTNHADAEYTLDLNLHGVRRVTEAMLMLMPQQGARIVMVGSGAASGFVSKCSEERQRFFKDPAVTWGGLFGLVAEYLATSQQATGADDPKAVFGAAGLGEGAFYGFTKALLHCYAVDLARAHPQKQINTCSPGFVETDLTRPFAEKAGKTPKEMGMITPQQGASAPLFLALGELPTPAGTAWYFGSDSKRSPLHRYRSPGDPPYDGSDD